MIPLNMKCPESIKIENRIGMTTKRSKKDFLKRPGMVAHRFR